MCKKDHEDHPGNEPLQHHPQLPAGIEPMPKPAREKKDQHDKKESNGRIDKKGRGSYKNMLFLVRAAADIFDMGIFQETALGHFKDTRDRQKKGPLPHPENT